MPNIDNLIAGLNKAKLCEVEEQNHRCACREVPCPLGGTCSQPNIVYAAKVQEKDETSSKYIGMTSNSFIVRFRNHKKKAFITLTTKQRVNCQRESGEIGKGGLNPR